MAYRSFTLEIADKIAHLKLNRPEKLNALDGVFWRELDEILAQLQRDVPGARARHLVERQAFLRRAWTLRCSNKAKRFRKATPAVRTALHEQILQLQHSFTRLETLRMPVIAAIQGACVGGALDMVTACDIRYATQRRVLLRPGNQYRPGRRRRYPATPAESDSCCRLRANTPTPGADCPPHARANSGW